MYGASSEPMAANSEHHTWTRPPIRSNEISSFICNFPFFLLFPISNSRRRASEKLPTIGCVSLKICSVTRKDWSPLTQYFAFFIQYFFFSSDVNAYFNLILFSPKKNIRHNASHLHKKLLILELKKNCTIKIMTVKHFLCLLVKQFFGSKSESPMGEREAAVELKNQIHHLSHQHSHYDWANSGPDRSPCASNTYCSSRFWCLRRQLEFKSASPEELNFCHLFNFAL